MHDWQSLSHVRWDCKYHIVIVPKYRKKVIYGKLRHQVGPILRQLCQQRGVKLLEGHAMPDHIHMCLSVPPKFSIARMNRIPEGQECRTHPPPIAPGTSDDGPVILGDRILRQYGWFG